MKITKTGLISFIKTNKDSIETFTVLAVIALFFAVAIGSWLNSGYFAPEPKSETTFNKIPFTYVEYSGFDKGQTTNGNSKLHVALPAINNGLRKIGKIKGKGVYEIIGLSPDEWIYIDTPNEMTGTLDLWNGLYKSDYVKLDSISDFAPDNVVIWEPQDSVVDRTKIFETSDSEEIEYFAKISSEKQIAENVSGIIEYERSFTVVFTSEKFPNLEYILNIYEMENKFYIYSCEYLGKKLGDRITYYESNDILIFID